MDPLQTPLKAIWKKIGAHHHHGFVVSLLGLHSKESAGCGEYLDLIPLIDWCKEAGFDIIQLLPVNDSGILTSPYSALSACALHPIYLRLESNAGAPPITKKRVDYLEVLNWKMEQLKKYHETAFKRTDDYEEFCNACSWLKPYALFRALKDKELQKPWRKWPEAVRHISHEQLGALCKEYSSQVDFYCMLQYLCYKQLKQVKEHADRQDVKLIGDVPILINGDSADVWYNNHYFDESLAAGAPPDIFNPNGQYWNFPLYNWPAIAQSDYCFWKERLHFANHFYHMYRIDHIIGFFRIWAIPLHHKPIEGSYIPSEPGLVLAQGRETLSQMIQFSDMLPIADDLGSMPDGADTLIRSMGMPGTRIMTIERLDKGEGPCIPITDHDPINLTMVSTHDLKSLRGWYHDFPSQAKLFCQMMGWPYEKELSLERQKKILHASHHSPTLLHVNLLTEYLDCVGLTSKDPEEDRLNQPGEILPTNWTYRYPLSIEEMAAHAKLKLLMQEVIK